MFGGGRFIFNCSTVIANCAVVAGGYPAVCICRQMANCSIDSCFTFVSLRKSKRTQLDADNMYENENQLDSIVQTNAWPFIG